MTRLSTAFGLVAALASPAGGQDLGPALSQAVREIDPALELPADRRLVHVADFDGDGRQDVAAVLVAPGRRSLVAFRALPSGRYEPHPLYATLPAGEVELRLLPPGRRRVLAPEGVIEHAAPALELVFKGRSSAIYVWRGNRFRVYATENY